jgi:hypothetical protein
MVLVILMGACMLALAMWILIGGGSRKHWTR